ncbi:hypothetical protein, partial [Staphylococcus aureus]
IIRTLSKLIEKSIKCHLFECVNYERKRVIDVKYTLTKLS